MKLSTSSSIFFATLALSSSSSTLAAPARDATESGLSVSPSAHDLSDSSHPAPHCSGHRTQPQPTPVSAVPIAPRSISALQLPPPLDALLASVPIVGPLLTQLGKLLVTGQNLASNDVNQISPQDMTALQDAIKQVTQALNNTVVSKLPVPPPLTNVANGLSISVAQSDFDPAGPAAASSVPGSASAMPPVQASSSPSMAANDVSSSSSKLPSPTPFMAVADVPSSSSKFPSASVTPPSVVPVNLPNSSTIPVHLPV